MAGYKNDIDNGWIALQVFPSPRTEIFASTTINSGRASIVDFGYDAGNLTAALFGLDYPLQSASMAGFSNLRIRRVSQSVGVNYRLTNNLVLNGMLAYEDYDDREPWLYDSTGRYVNVFAGIGWIF